MRTRADMSWSTSSRLQSPTSVKVDSSMILLLILLFSILSKQHDSYPHEPSKCFIKCKTGFLNLQSYSKYTNPKTKILNNTSKIISIDNLYQHYNDNFDWDNKAHLLLLLDDADEFIKLIV